jgi:hypothetical protein
MRTRLLLAAITTVAFAVTGCNTGSKSTPTPTPDPVTAPTPSPSPSTEGALHLGAPIEPSTQKVALSDVAKAPSSFVGKTFATTGTVTAVCQHMGCWMEIKDDASEAHIKMAGHGFFVPKTASGRKARVLAKLEKADNEGSCEGEGHEGMSASATTTAAGDGNGKEKKGCRAEAEAQMGRPLAKLELVAEGVELM